MFKVIVITGNNFYPTGIIPSQKNQLSALFSADSW